MGFFLLLLQEEMAKHTTPMYRAPEMLDTWNHYSIHTPSDIWALGCLLYFLCFGRHPFEDSAKLAILNGNFKIPENDITFDAFHDLIRQMLVVDPSFRPSINQVQEHLGKRQALKKYDQFALNTSCFWGIIRSNITPVCAISRNFYYKNNE